MAVTISNIKRDCAGSQFKIDGRVTFDSSYATGGEQITAEQLGLSIIEEVVFEDSGGYTFDSIIATGGASALLKAYNGASGISGATSGGTPAGTNSATQLNLATPAFSGTGLTAAGQVITTTDNQTMTLDQCAGMWLLAATAATPPMLIVSNTAVTGAPAVLTVIGAAATDAGAYKIVKNVAATFTGSALATHTHALSAAAGGEVAGGTNLSSLAIDFVAYGR